MRNIRSTVLGIFMIFAAVGNAGVSVLDNDPATTFDYLITFASISTGVGLIWMREEKQHTLDLKSPDKKD